MSFRQRLPIAAVVLLSSAAVAAGASFGTVQNNSQLSAKPSTFASTFERLGFAAAGDSNPAFYNASNAACTLNSGAGDGGSQVPASDGKCWVLTTNGEADVRIWGAKCNANGANTDDSVAINAALSWASQNTATIVFPNTACRSSAGVVQGPYASARGTTYAPQQDYGVSAPYTYTGSGIVCDLAVTPCWTMSQSTGVGHNGQQRLSELSIYRAAGTVTTNQECLVDKSWYTTIENVFCNGHSNGFHRYGAGANGLISNYEGISTCNISGSDFIQDGAADTKIHHARWGCNSAIIGANPRITTHENYVLITGKGPGPNTLMITDSMFNDSLNPTCAWNWSDIAQNAASSTEFRFRGNHLEFTGQPTAPHSVFCFNAPIPQTNDVGFADNTIIDFNGTGTVFNFNTTTSGLANWKVSNNTWGGFTKKGWTLTPSMSPAAPLYDYESFGNVYTNALVTVTMPAGSGVRFDDAYTAGLTLNGSPAAASFSGVLRAGAFTNNVTKPQVVHVDISGVSRWSPYDVVPHCSSGSLAGYLQRGSYFQSGETTHVAFELDVSRVGDCTFPLTLSLPSVAATNGVIAGREYQVTGAVWNAQIAAGQAVAAISSYSNSFSVAAGWKLSFSGSYNSQ